MPDASRREEVVSTLTLSEEMERMTRFNQRPFLTLKRAELDEGRNRPSIRERASAEFVVDLTNKAFVFAYSIAKMDSGSLIPDRGSPSIPWSQAVSRSAIASRMDG